MNVFLFTFLIIFGLQIFFFLIATTFQTDKVTDLAYGISFFIALWLVFLSAPYSLTKLLIVIAVTLWGLRLAVYLFIRILKIGKDKRFDDKREKFWEFAKFWILQTVSVWTILLPYTWFIDQPAMDAKPLFYVGLVIWAVGLTIEAAADQQKFHFKNQPENKGKWTDVGLWNYSRHPNYFGEIICWVGLFIAVFPYLSGIRYLFIISPIYITSLLLFVSGIPLLEKRYEKKYGDNRKYQQYKDSTSILIPWFKKK